MSETGRTFYEPPRIESIPHGLEAGTGNIGNGGPLAINLGVDADGTYGAGWPPFNTMSRIALGMPLIPAETVSSSTQHSSSLHRETGSLDKLNYRWRWITRDAKTYLPRIQGLLRGYGYSPNTVILSGRGEKRRVITEGQLDRAGVTNIFDSLILTKSSQKPLVVEDWLRKGSGVIIFEDDLTTALKEVARYENLKKQRASEGKETPPLMIFLFNNPWINPLYRKWFLKRCGIDALPKEITMVRDFKGAYLNIQSTLHARF